MKACQLTRTKFPQKTKKQTDFFPETAIFLDSNGLFVDIVINSIMNYVLRLTKELGLLKTIDLNLFIFLI